MDTDGPEIDFTAGAAIFTVHGKCPALFILAIFPVLERSIEYGKSRFENDRFVLLKQLQ